MIKKIKSFFKNGWKEYEKISGAHASEILKWEVAELENIFSLLVIGSFVGFPSAPLNITLDLLPFMDRELSSMIEKVTMAHDPLGELFSLLDIG